MCQDKNFSSTLSKALHRLNVGSVCDENHDDGFKSYFSRNFPDEEAAFIEFIICTNKRDSVLQHDSTKLAVENGRIAENT